MRSMPLIPAAQYVRMSTEDQQYSILNQQTAIGEYARKHGYEVVTTYADPGKSGVAMKDRNGLRSLLADVMGGCAPFKAILVYDISRWGRFQDIDESAHYEFVCRSAGIPVRYCAEQFDNDGSVASSMMKALKRTMAAEYSRELGTKVLAGQRRIASLGFRSVGSAGFGMRRMMISRDGRRRIVLRDGERKAIHTDRIVLVPGPKIEVECVRTMFRLAADGKSTKEIAKELNTRRMLSPRGRPWLRSTIHRILTNEKYAGSNTYGKTTQRLSSVSRVVKREQWITQPDAFVSIVSRDLFDRVQKQLSKRWVLPVRSNAYHIRRMKRILARYGKLTHRLVGQAYYRRFGSVFNAFAMVGYVPRPRLLKRRETQARLRSLRESLYSQLRELFRDRIRFLNSPRQKLSLVAELDGCCRLAVYLCRAIANERTGELRWLLRVRASDRHLPVLFCAVDQSQSRLCSLYVLPPFDRSLKCRLFRDSQLRDIAIAKLGTLADLFAAAYKVAAHCGTQSECTCVDDILVRPDSWTVSVGRAEVSLGPVTCAIFRVLVMNADQVVSMDRLLESVPEGIDLSDLNRHIYILRTKLGAHNRSRIQTIRGEGYKYVARNAGSLKRVYR